MPVRIPARDGEQTGDEAYACVNLMPLPASESICGVSLKGLPYAPRSVYPRSSARMKITFGLSCAASMFPPGKTIIRKGNKSEKKRQVVMKRVMNKGRKNLNLNGSHWHGDAAT